jgi:succinoglycan biosynthesis protein ExoM
MIDHITVCVCTFRRNRTLIGLLRNLALQKTRDQFTFSVVIVDNDALGSAQADVARLSSEASMEIVYSIEPEKMIPAARNRAIRLAKGNYVAIIDDDEFPLDNWLVTLYEAVRAFQVDGALGPVYPFFEQYPPPWLIKSGLLELPHLRTGTLLQWNQTRTGNVLLKKEVFDRHGIIFDKTFATGGSDQAFFRQAMGFGFRFIAVDEAPVYEIVPPERWRKTYFLRRALVNGFNAQKYVTRDGRTLNRIAAFLKSGSALLAYMISIPVCACLGAHILIPCMQNGLYHLSRLAATFGIEMLKKRDF